MALEEAVGGEQLTTAAFRRLLAAAGENDAARVEVLLALAERQVCVVMEPGAGRSRCLTNGDGESAMPVFTGTDLQTEVAQRFGWVDAAGACEARVLRDKEAFHMALLQDVEFIVVDITFEHAAEFSREEIEAALAVPRQRAATAAQQGKARQAVEQVREAVRRSTRPPGGPQGFSPEAKVPPAPRVPAATEAQPARKLRERRPAQVVELAELDDPFASRRKRKERARAEAAAARTNAGRAPVPPPTAAQVPVPPPTAAQVPVPPPIAAQVPVPPPAASPLGPSTPTGDAAGYDFGAPRADVAAAPDAMPALPELDAAPGAPPHAPPREHASPTDPGVPAFDNAPPAFGEAAPPAMPALPDDNAAPPAFGAPTDAGPPAFGAPPDVGPPAFGTPTDAGPPAFGAPNAVDQGAPAYGQSAPGYGQAAPSWNEPFGGAGAQAHPEALEAAALVTQVARESGDADAVDAAAEVANLLKQTARGDDDEAPAVSGAASALARAFTAQTADGKTTLGAGPAAPSATGAAAGDEDALGEVVPESVVTAGVKSAARTLIGMFKKGEVVAADAAEPEAAEEADEGMRESEPEPEGLRAPEAPLEDEVLEALSSALGPYLEVEWACQCADEGELPVLGVRVDPSFDQRVDEIEATLAKAARARGVDATVVVLTDPQVMRQARKVGTVFHPFRRKPKPRG